jgi:hypothetical protein
VDSGKDKTMSLRPKPTTVSKEPRLGAVLAIGASKKTKEVRFYGANCKANVKTVAPNLFKKLFAADNFSANAFNTIWSIFQEGVKPSCSPIFLYSATVDGIRAEIMFDTRQQNDTLDNSVILTIQVSTKMQSSDMEEKFHKFVVKKTRGKDGIEEETAYKYTKIYNNDDKAMYDSVKALLTDKITSAVASLISQ